MKSRVIVFVGKNRVLLRSQCSPLGDVFYARNISIIRVVFHQMGEYVVINAL